MIKRALIALFVSLLFSTSLYAAQCGGSFETFLAAAPRATRRRQGVSRDHRVRPSPASRSDQNVLAFDRRQRGTFRKSFRGYVATRSAPPASSAGGR